MIFVAAYICISPQTRYVDWTRHLVMLHFPGTGDVWGLGYVACLCAKALHFSTFQLVVPPISKLLALPLLSEMVFPRAVGRSLKGLGCLQINA